MVERVCGVSKRSRSNRIADEFFPIFQAVTHLAMSISRSLRPRPFVRNIVRNIVIFSRVLRDSTPRFVVPLVGWSVG